MWDTRPRVSCAISAQARAPTRQFDYISECLDFRRGLNSVLLVGEKGGQEPVAQSGWEIYPMGSDARPEDIPRGAVAGLLIGQ
jgi:hypothetical protein